MSLNHLVCICGRCTLNSNKKVFKAFPRNEPTMTSFLMTSLMTSLTCSATDWTSAAATLASLSGWSKDPPLSFEIPMAAFAAEKWFIVVGRLEAILDFFSIPFHFHPVRPFVPIISTPTGFHKWDFVTRFKYEDDHRHISLKVPNVKFDFDVWFSTLMD